MPLNYELRLRNKASCLLHALINHEGFAFRDNFEAYALLCGFNFQVSPMGGTTHAALENALRKKRHNVIASSASWLCGAEGSCDVIRLLAAVNRNRPISGENNLMGQTDGRTDGRTDAEARQAGRPPGHAAADRNEGLGRSTRLSLRTHMSLILTAARATLSS